MHLDVKTFNDSNESDLAIKKVTAKAGLSHGASIEIFYAPENKNAIMASLTNAGISTQSVGRASLTIKADGLFRCGRLREALETLKSAGFVSEAFMRQISDNFPDGHGGLHPLNNDLLERTTLESHVIDFTQNYLSRRNVMPSREYDSVITEARNLPFFTRHPQSGTGINPHSSIEISQGPYAKKITDLNIPDENIPDEYKCPLSLSIMSDPVYLQGDETGQRFERSWITKWLSDKSTHPSTRKSFELAAIQSDTELKTSIDEFMQRLESATSLDRK